MNKDIKRSCPVLLGILLISSMPILPLRAGEVVTKEVVVIEETVKEEPWVKPTADIRARYEYGEEDPLDESHAGTLRARLGLLTREYYGFQFFAEYEGTITADRDSYRAASVHGPTDKTIIADPESHELNQLWGSYKFDFVKVQAGRQAINLDNQRYVGGVGWRQNMQTFDAAAVTLTPVEDLKLYYGYVNQVNRIFGSEPIGNPAQEDFEGDTHLVNAQYTGLPFGTLTCYAYFMDLHNPVGDANSNQSFGAILAGKLPIDPLSYRVEYGYQTDAFDSPRDYGTNYAHANIAAATKPVSFEVGYEYLGSDNGVGYNFPLGTNHAFNGFADKFLATPGPGLQDIYAGAGIKLPYDIGFKVIYHKFYSAVDSIDFGNEIDAVLTKDLGHGFSVLGKYAYYWAEDAPYTDTNRISIELDYKF